MSAPSQAELSARESFLNVSIEVKRLEGLEEDSKKNGDAYTAHHLYGILFNLRESIDCLKNIVDKLESDRQ